MQTIQKNLSHKIGEQLSCEYSMSTIWAFDDIENKYTLYRGEDCMKKFCSSLREYATNVNIFLKTKKMLQLNKKGQNATVLYICRKRFSKTFADTTYQKFRDHFQYRGIEQSICHLKFNVANTIPVVFYIRSNYEYHFIIKDKMHTSLRDNLNVKTQKTQNGETQESTKPFSVTIKKRKKLQKLIKMAMEVF